MSAGTRRNGNHKFGSAGRPTGRHSVAKKTVLSGKRTYKAGQKAARSGKAVPAAAIAMTLAAGAAAYGVTASGVTASDAPVPEALAADISAVPGPPAASGAGAKAAVAAEAMAGAAPAQLLSIDTVRSNAIRAAAAPSRPAKPAASPKPSRPASAAKPAVRSLACADTGGLLPANVTAIVSFLVDHGYSHNAAAGIAGNIYQESKGNPESAGMGGGGLIGFTPLPAGYVTGDVAADLRTQLSAVLTFNQQWSGYLPALNEASSPAAAAAVYVTDFERAGSPAAATRAESATDVAAACGL